MFSAADLLLYGSLAPIALIGVIVVVRKFREWQWGWVSDRYSLSGRVYIVTGANCGLGFETAKVLAGRDATVILACRSEQRAQEAIVRIRQCSAAGALVFMPLDLSSAASVCQFAQQLLQRHPRFHCLINNAGVATATKRTNAAGLELTFATNHLGHFMLVQQLAAAIEENGARVVIVSSSLHRHGEIKAEQLGRLYEVPQRRGHNAYYNDSKLANFYHGRELYRRGVDAHVLCPGLCHTDFFRDYNPRWFHYVMFAPLIWLMLRTAEQGAQNIVWAATDNVNTAERNPATGYFVRNVKMGKSSHPFEEEVSRVLWSVSERMSAEAMAGPEA